MRRLAGALAFGVCMSAAYHASAHTTLDQPTSAPPPSLAAGATYDVAHRALVVVGGSSPAATVGETWIWNGARWRQLSATGPSPRAEPLLAYDGDRSRVVLYGGDRGGGEPPLGDTWDWDGRAWRRIDVAGPGARDHVAMTYSPMLRGIVLHGGRTPSAGMLADTWLYDGRAWTRLLDAGPPRGRHRLGYDPDERAVILYGGYDGRQRTSELWALRARAWERLAP